MKLSARETLPMSVENFSVSITEGTRKSFLVRFETDVTRSDKSRISSSKWRKTFYCDGLFHSKTGLVPNRRYASRYLTHACHGLEFLLLCAYICRMLHAVHRTDGFWWISDVKHFLSSFNRTTMSVSLQYIQYTTHIQLHIKTVSS